MPFSSFNAQPVIPTTVMHPNAHAWFSIIHFHFPPLSNTLGGVVQPTRPPSFYGSKISMAMLYRCRQPTTYVGPCNMYYAGSKARWDTCYSLPVQYNKSIFACMPIDCKDLSCAWLLFFCWLAKFTGTFRRNLDCSSNRRPHLTVFHC